MGDDGLKAASPVPAPRWLWSDADWDRRRNAVHAVHSWKALPNGYIAVS